MISGNYHNFFHAGSSNTVNKDRWESRLSREEKEKLWESREKQELPVRREAGIGEGEMEELPGKNGEGETEDDGKTVPKAETETKILVKPDGSRVLVVTVRSEGRIRTMSLKISEPTDMPNREVKNIENNSFTEGGEEA